MSVVFWDTMLFIYLLEGNTAYVDRVTVILRGMETRGDKLVTSAFTLAEVLVAPLKRSDPDAAERIRQGVRRVAEIVPFTAETAARYAEIRARHRFSSADSIQLACAAQANADLFLTNDHRLVGAVIPGIQFVVGLDINLY